MKDGKKGPVASKSVPTHGNFFAGPNPIVNGKVSLSILRKNFDGYKTATLKGIKDSAILAEVENTIEGLYLSAAGWFTGAHQGVMSNPA